MFHLLTNGPSNMVFEHFQNFFDHEDSANVFIQLQQLCSNVATNHILSLWLKFFVLIDFWL
jgi:hypothetical protein